MSDMPKLRSKKNLPQYGLPITVGVTGHRKLKNPSAILPVLKAQMTAIQNSFPDSPIYAVSALAEGADCLFAQLAVDMGWELHVALPMAKEYYVTDNDFSEAGKRTFEILYKLAENRQVVMSDVIPGSADLIKQDGLYRNLQYAKVGIYIAQRSHILIALWDGQDVRGIGGTAQIVSFRETGHLHLPPQNTMPSAFTPGMLAALMPVNPLYPPEIGLVCKIFCERDEAGSQVREGYAPLEVEWTDGQDKYPSFDVLLARKNSKSTVSELLKIDGWNCRIQKDLESNGLPSAPSNFKDFRTKAYISHIMLDRMVTGETKKIRRNFGFAFIFLAVTSILNSRAPGDSENWVIFSLLCSVIGFGIFYYIVKKTGWQTQKEETIKIRTLVEGLKIQNYWNIIGIQDAIFLKYPAYESTVFKSVRYALQGNSLPGQLSADYARKIEYIQEDWIDNQKKYYGETKLDSDKEIIKKMKFSIKWLYRFGILFLIFLATHALTEIFYEYSLPSSIEKILHFMDHASDLLVVFAGLLFSYLEFAGFEEDANNYRVAASLFDRADEVLKNPFGEATKDEKKTDISVKITQAAQREVLKYLGEEIIREDNVRWAERSRSKKLSLIQ